MQEIIFIEPFSNQYLLHVGQKRNGKNSWKTRNFLFDLDNFKYCSEQRKDLKKLQIQSDLDKRLLLIFMSSHLQCMPNVIVVSSQFHHEPAVSSSCF